ncbi:MAG: hypothetical protein J6P16_01485 [Eubacterium sp.]|nr:hypothetical protein [Eubacterium sp.]
MITMDTNTAGRTAIQPVRTQDDSVNKASIENKVEAREEAGARSEVRRELSGKSAAEEMRKDNAINSSPEDGIRLEISRQGLESQRAGADRRAEEDEQADEARNEADRTQAAAREDEDRDAVRTASQDEASATEQRIEEQQKVREKIREQVEKELDDEENEIRQADRRAEDEQNRVREDSEEEEEREQNTANFAGYTNAQLQQMYQQGEISQNDYRTEIKNREEKIAEKQQSMQDTDEELARGIGRADRMERRMNAIDTAFDEDSNTNINARTRNEAIESLENPQNTRRAEQDAQRDQQARAFARWQNDFGFLIR